MPAPFIIPFNNNITSSARGTTATYTVPAGKYTLLKVQYDFSFACSRSGGVLAAAGPSILATGTGATSGELSIWMKSGETITLTAANTTGTLTSATSTSSFAFSVNSIAGFSITINSVLWKVVQSRGSTAGTDQNNNGTASTITITPTANFGWYAQEYNEIS